MTAWSAEKLRFEGEDWWLRSFPLEAWLRPRGYRHTPRSTANWRGYDASWAVLDGVLHLTGLSGAAEVDGAARHLGGLVGLPAGKRASPLSACEGLVWHLEPDPSVPPWSCFTSDDTVAVLVDDPSLVERGSVLEADGVRVPSDGVWRLAAPASQWHSLHVSVPDGADPVPEGWFPEREPAPPDPADPFAFRERPRAFVRRPADPGSHTVWWSAADLHIATSERKKLVAEELFGRPRPVPALWVTDRLWAVGGDVLEYVHAAFESRFEKSLWLDLEQGRVVGASVTRTPAGPVAPLPATGRSTRPWWRRLLGR